MGGSATGTWARARYRSHQPVDLGAQHTVSAVQAHCLVPRTGQCLGQLTRIELALLE